MMNIIIFFIGFFCAEGIWTALGGRSVFRRKSHRDALYETIEERAKRIRTTMDRLRDRDRSLHHDGTGDSGPGEKVLRALTDGRVRRD